MGERSENEIARQFHPAGKPFPICTEGTMSCASLVRNPASAFLMLLLLSSGGSGLVLHTPAQHGTSTTRQSVFHNDGNLCADGKLLPELYLLGSPRCGSSTLSYDFVHAGMKVASDLSQQQVQLALESGNFASSGAKEWHFFDNWVTKGGKEGEEAEHQAWLGKLPACPVAPQGESSSAPRQILADFTPAYLRMVPLPEGSVAAEDALGRTNIKARGFYNGSTDLLHMTSMLKRYYGDDLSKRLTLMTLLREPLARMQSNWYIDPHLPSPATFEDALKQALAQAKLKPPMYSEWIWSSMYAWGFEHWLKNFNASQLVVVLSKNYLTGGKQALCTTLSERLSFPMNCDSNKAQSSHLNPHEHPRLEDDLSQETRTQINELFDRENQHLVKILAKAHSDGALLFNYHGKLGSEEDIWSWLQAGW